MGTARPSAPRKQGVMQDPNKSPSQADRKASNRRLGLILFSIVMVFFLGFFAKMIFLG
ncbi:hypothetical protein F7R26_002100 [Cupriavidus basilensis]|uniref:Uncharacterized protein n=2 Tax=Cupriavidus basilensis TaxID=68895 RepID=A0A7M2H2P4_9BURK|nr:hypothetical protein F7R26_002100 [Cupriavidus basilensis]